MKGPENKNYIVITTVSIPKTEKKKKQRKYNYYGSFVSAFDERAVNKNTFKKFWPRNIIFWYLAAWKKRSQSVE